MNRLSKWFYLGSMVGGIIGGIVLLMVAAILLVTSGILSNFVLNVSYAGVGPAIICSLLILLGCGAILYGASIWYLLLYKAWAVIQDGHASTTPEKAVGFIFIPFYNFYWIFKAWHGLARDYNRYIGRHGFQVPALRGGLFLTFCILFICIQIPIVVYAAGLPFFVIFGINTNELIDGVNGLLLLQDGDIR
jgi:hypothetical protein